MTRGLGPVLLAFAALLTVTPPTHSFAASADRMVDEQLERRGIKDHRVLDAFRRVHREAYVPPEVRDRAYDDSALPIGYDQTISQPYIVAFMTQLLELRDDQRVLEIGTGSGYQAAILAELAHDVYTVEIVPELATTARLRLTREGYRNVHVKQGDGANGWKEYSPYGAIIVTAAAPKVPQPLIDQLADGGVLVMPVGDPNGRQVLIRGVKRGGKLHSREITNVQFVPMTGASTSGGAAAEGSPAAKRATSERASGPPSRENGSDESERQGAPAVHEHARDEYPPAVHEPRGSEDRSDEDVERREPDAEWHRDEAGDAGRDERRRSEDEDARRLERDGRRDDHDDEWKPDGDSTGGDDRRHQRSRDDLNENQDDQDDDGPESDTRPHRDERTRVARVRDARDTDRLGAASAGERVAARSPAASR